MELSNLGMWFEPSESTVRVRDLFRRLVSLGPNGSDCFGPHAKLKWMLGRNQPEQFIQRWG